ncbi:hypothetical protein EYF80_055133 [Liparis tanakae]|uniref:Uncharacterized protein n=1 Tax=Liparis tanakae TaxID=230148 RepID=A0A4Z2F1Y8_9TELE|nr:hypothetical protein EYF80_055133 [Liparis tanakae]
MESRHAGTFHLLLHGSDPSHRRRRGYSSTANRQKGKAVRRLDSTDPSSLCRVGGDPESCVPYAG